MNIKFAVYCEFIDIESYNVFLNIFYSLYFSGNTKCKLLRDTPPTFSTLTETRVGSIYNTIILAIYEFATSIESG